MDDVQRHLVELGGGDPFDAVLQHAQQHQAEHDCGLFPAGPAVMQLAAMCLRAARLRTILDLGCGIGYSTFWLAEAGGPDATVTGIDAMLELLRPGGLLTMPNWFLLIDALTGEPRNDWERWAGPTWADDALAYADLLSARQDLAVSWVIQPPLGIAVKRSPAVSAGGRGP